MEEHGSQQASPQVSVFRSPASGAALPQLNGAADPESAAPAPGEDPKGLYTLKVTRTDGEHATDLRIEGVLDAITSMDMRAVVESVVATGRLQVQLDLAPLRLIDSSGVGALVSLYKRVRAKGGAVSVAGLRDQPLAVFRLLRLDHIFSI